MCGEGQYDEYVGGGSWWYLSDIKYRKYQTWQPAKSSHKLLIAFILLDTRISYTLRGLVDHTDVSKKIRKTNILKKKFEH